MSTGLALVLAMAAIATTATIGSADFEVPRPGDGPRVVLLHGLIRSGRSMTKMGEALSEAGYRVCNITYPSRHHTIEVLAAEYVAPQVERCFPDRGRPVHFVTHSMGGILVRQLAASGAMPDLGRVVMLGPPNGGSELVDRFGHWWLFEAVNGPAALELGTDGDSAPVRLGPATFEVGVIAGDKSWNWLLSRYFPGPNDGKVSVKHATLEGMRDFVVVDVTHTFLMRDEAAIWQTLHFLEDGVFGRRLGEVPWSSLPNSSLPDS